MDDIFGKLQSLGKNCVDNLSNWIKMANILPKDFSADKLTQLFSDVGDKNNVQLGEFKSVIDKLSGVAGTSSSDIISKLVTEAPKILGQMIPGFSGAAGGAEGTVASAVKGVMGFFK